MEYKYIVYKKEGNVATVTLNKPEKLNAIGLIGLEEDCQELLQAYKQAADDDDVKVMILRGAGRAFSTGQDLSRVGVVYGFGTGQPGERRPSERIRLKMDRDSREVFSQLFLHPKLTIAQVHGYCLEGGVELAMACDVTIATEDAQLGFPGQRLGFAGCSVNLPILISRVGLTRAIDLVLTGRHIDGKEAERIGLVTKAVPSNKLEEEVKRYAETLCLLPRDGIAIGKAARHLVYDNMGLTSTFAQDYIMHTLFTNLRWEPDEHSFFKVRREKGAKAAFHERDTRYAASI